MTITLDTLVNASEKELAKMKKEDIFTALRTFGFQYKNALEEKKNAIAASKQSEAETLAAKKTLRAYVNLEFREDQIDYNGSVKWDTVSLSELVGFTLVKASRY